VTDRHVRVLLADDHTLVRSGIRKILEGQPGIVVVAEAADGAAALDLVRTTDADVLVLDLKMPGTDGIDVLRAVKSGADAYLLKDSAVQDLVAAVDAVVAGHTYFSPAIQQQLAGLLRTGGQAPTGTQVLTDREREVLTWLARGLSSKEVAKELNISVRTVETHRANLMHKLGVKSVAVLIQVAMREGIIDPTP
jgi:DNA-binding NarL/FixJ family response regulator